MTSFDRIVPQNVKLSKFTMVVKW